MPLLSPYHHGTMLIVASALASGIAVAGEADVIGVRPTRAASGLYNFAVTVRSRDTGWERYADRMEVVTTDGRVLATRVLEHPHDDEQPFTREITGVRLPDGGRVTVRVHFKPSGFDGSTGTVVLPGDAR